MPSHHRGHAGTLILCCHSNCTVLLMRARPQCSRLGVNISNTPTLTSRSLGTHDVWTQARGGHGLSVKQTEEGEAGRRSSVSSHGRQREAESLGWSRVKARAKERIGQTGTASSFPWTIRRLPRAPRLSAADTCGGRVECGLPERGGRLCLESRPASVNKSTA